MVQVGLRNPQQLREAFPEAGPLGPSAMAVPAATRKSADGGYRHYFVGGGTLQFGFGAGFAPEAGTP